MRLAPVVTDLDENSLRTVTVYPEIDQVTVTGPTSAIDSIAQVVLPVEVSGGTQTFDGVYVPEAHDADGNFTSIGNQQLLEHILYSLPEKMSRPLPPRAGGLFRRWLGTVCAVQAADYHQ